MLDYNKRRSCCKIIRRGLDLFIFQHLGFGRPRNRNIKGNIAHAFFHKPKIYYYATIHHLQLSVPEGS